MDKRLLHKQIISELELVYHVALDATQRAYETAVDEENEAENKYDTLGLEASYLAHGQSQRVEECHNDLMTFSALPIIQFSSKVPITIGTLIYIENEQGEEQGLFLSPVAGGLKVQFNNKEINLITPSSPIGKALSSSTVGNEISIKINNEMKFYEITKVY